MASGCAINLVKLSNVKLPFSSVKANTTISISGNTTNIAENITYGIVQLLREEKNRRMLLIFTSFYFYYCSDYIT